MKSYRYTLLELHLIAIVSRNIKLECSIKENNFDKTKNVKIIEIETVLCANQKL